jgi:hypothetical protein
MTPSLSTFRDRWRLAVVVAGLLAIFAILVVGLVGTAEVVGTDQPLRRPVPVQPREVDLVRTPSIPTLSLAPPTPSGDAVPCDLAPEAGWSTFDRRAIAAALQTEVEGTAMMLPALEGQWRRWVEGVGLVSLRWGSGQCSARRVDATLVEIDADGADAVSGCGPIRRMYGTEDRFIVRWVQPGIDSCQLVALWLDGSEPVASLPVDLTAARGERRALQFVPAGRAPPELDHLAAILASNVLSDLMHVDGDDTGQ